MGTLEWELQWGPHMKLLEQNAADGKPVPALDNRPVLEDNCWSYWDAFQELHDRRTSSGSGPQPIVLTDFVAWLDLMGVDEPEERERFFRVIRSMDQAYLKWAAEEFRKERGRTPSHHQPPRSGRRGRSRR